MKARENPFRRERIEALAYRAPDFDWAELEARLTRLGGQGALVGPKGHGKTTLLEQWAARVPGSLHFRIAEGQRFLTPAQRQALCESRAAFVLVDSAEQLGWLGWRELRRRVGNARRLAITTHRPGRLPTLRHCQTSPQLLGELAAELTGVPRDCTALWRRHRGDLRRALRELYDAGHCKKPLPAPRSVASLNAAPIPI
ncbi:MAG TPA: hypothetical protein VIS74_05700 [Chthoniobacterales bacterium]